ncbi:MAG TPA: ribose 5-phosphate isomerase B [Candidatus Sumerlaeota bacterium]|nr:MAG: putative sugar phosphate isomerase YwlF [candidate division BRC1 bacterium ADurb.BinA292]HOE96064.1 ribose 5-phosphate isomerase B [Candidatus Sumerlaeota bacterium]HOR26498.1 ribose 5-phosphate isomerase B [Candidatus Sumerlaeota bacterium]HPK01843.1 ribose 5-phosphate isomerase B [Candidatus Sumerlaeota bacterium]
MRIAFANDHAAVAMRQPLLEELAALGHEVLDLGARDESRTDYPDFARAVGDALHRGQADRGIVVCGTGVGICIAANKLRGIRCALVTDEYAAVMSRRHNDANVLALRGREFDPDLNRKLLRRWLETPFDGDERHQRRIDKIARLEELNE